MGSLNRAPSYHPTAFLPSFLPSFLPCCVASFTERQPLIGSFNYTRGGRGECPGFRGEALQSGGHGEVDDNVGVRGEREPEARRLLAEGRHFDRSGLLGLQVIRWTSDLEPRVETTLAPRRPILNPAAPTFKTRPALSPGLVIGGAGGLKCTERVSMRFNAPLEF
jgi:hypothetical protein